MVINTYMADVEMARHFMGFLRWSDMLLQTMGLELYLTYDYTVDWVNLL